jgi:hypothetical protein
MRFYTRTHKHYCGVDLHARSMYACVLDAEGNVLVSKNIAATPEPFLELIAPYREDLAVAATSSLRHASSPRSITHIKTNTAPLPGFLNIGLKTTTSGRLNPYGLGGY